MIKVKVSIITSEGFYQEHGSAIDIDPRNYKSNDELISEIKDKRAQSKRLASYFLRNDETSSHPFLDISVQGDFVNKTHLENELNNFADSI